MIYDLAIALTWLAAGYRTWVLFKQPPTIWRVSFTVAMLCAALSFTASRFRAPIDELVGYSNVAGLAARVFMLVGVGFLMVYLETLRRPTVSSERTAAYLSAVGLASALLIVSWSLAPLHEAPITDLHSLAADRTVVSYCLTFWIFLGWTALGIARTCLNRRRTFRRNDPARSVCHLLIGCGAVASLPVLAAWSTSLLYRHLTGRSADRVTTFGDRLMPWPVLLNAVGVLALVTLPYTLDFVATQRRWRSLAPFWRDLISRFPQVHLRLEHSGGPLTRMRMREERAIIEISDALQLARVDLNLDDGRVPPVESVGLALRRPAPYGRSASALLPRCGTRREDIDQLIALADAYTSGGE